ncbi:MAG: ABC transporter permease [Oscillospiraceae bacterium]|nr:ABC transporter permease [Oscillospiraceae bacterium]
MLVFIIRRILQTIPVLIGVTFVVFIMLHLMPGDPAVVIGGEAASPETLAQIREDLGLNDSVPVQYFRFLSGALRGDLGMSMRNRDRAVVDEIFDARFAITVQLAVVSTAFSVLLGLVIGIVSATRKYSIADTGLMLFALLGLSMPNFWLGILMMNFFAVTLRILPTSGWGTWQQMIMPVVMLGVTGTAVIARMTRASLLDVLNQDYIRTAYSKGLAERKVIFKHALRNALIPVITVVGLQFGGLLAGAILTETVFAINGLGRLIVQSIANRDFPMAQGAILVVATLFVLVNMIVDITYKIVNRRIDLN